MHELEIEFRVMALKLYIASGEADYDGAAADLDELVALSKELVDQKVSFTSALQDKFFQTVDMLLQHYPQDEKVRHNDYAVLCEQNPAVIELINQHTDKFALFASA